MSRERLQKVVAASGLYSRRQVEKMMSEGRIRVNGQVVTKMGSQVDPALDQIAVDAKPFTIKPKENITILFNKPRHVVVTRSDPEGRSTVFDFLPKELKHLKPAGRLDYMSQGALILSSDGELINHLTHPKYHLPKIYEVKIVPHPDEKQLRKISQGVSLDGKRTEAATVKLISMRDSSSLIRITLHEGRNRQVRRMCELVGLTVKELRRVSIGPVELGRLVSGKFRPLTPTEIRKLRGVERRLVRNNPLTKSKK